MEQKNADEWEEIVENIKTLDPEEFVKVLDKIAELEIKKMGKKKC